MSLCFSCSKERRDRKEKTVQLMRMVEDFSFNYEKENMENILTEARKQRFKPRFSEY